jgi:MFS family permease
MPSRLTSWTTLTALSVLLFLISASVFGSLGVVLPYMVKDEKWSWGLAGLGYALMGGACGGSSWIPAKSMRRIGARATFAVGTVITTAGLLCWAFTHGIASYLMGAILAGAGYQFLALIPGTHVLSPLFKKPGLPLGIYFTSAGLGGAAGPMMVLWVLHAHPDGWRLYWLIQAGVTVVAGLACALVMHDAERMRAAPVAEAVGAPDAAVAAGAGDQGWTVRDALHTPQFYVLLAAYFAHLIVGATIGSVSVGYMTELGYSIVLASSLHSLESLLATASRFIAGVAADYIHPRYLIVLGLALLTVGSAALSAINTHPAMMFAYVGGVGLGYGFVVLATPMVLMEFYGRKPNLELYALVAMAGVLAALGPFAAGLLRDWSGQFTLSFNVLAVVSLIVLAATVLMKPPRRRQGQTAGSSAAPISDLSTKNA